MEDCFGCIGAIKLQREQYRNIIKQAREIAKEQNTTITIYRTTSGEYTLEATNDIAQYISPFL